MAQNEIFHLKSKMLTEDAADLGLWLAKPLDAALDANPLKTKSRQVSFPALFVAIL